MAAEERYDFIARTVYRFGYRRLKRAEKAVVLRSLDRVSGYSRQQLTRLVKRGGERGPLLKRYHGSRTSFVRTYTSADVILLAATDTSHGTLSGLATKKLMERAYRVLNDARYERLAVISVVHLYNLRKHSGYERYRAKEFLHLSAHDRCERTLGAGGASGDGQLRRAQDTLGKELVCEASAFSCTLYADLPRG